MNTRERLDALEQSAGVGGCPACRGPAGAMVRGWKLSRLSDEELRWMRNLYARDGGELRLSPAEQEEMARLAEKCTAR